MRTLAERDAAAVAAAAAELAALDDPTPFPPHFLQRLALLLASPLAAYSELDRSAQRALFYAEWVRGLGAREGVVEDASIPSPYWRLRHQHPVCSYRERTGDFTSAMKASDFVIHRTFSRREIWNELYRELGVRDWIDVGLEPTGGRTRMLIAIRDGEEFDERDRIVLQLLQPHLQRRHDRVVVAAEAANALASLEGEGGDAPSNIVLCSRNGVIEFASADARRLLAHYLGGLAGRLPPRVLQNGGSVLERDGRRITIRAVRCDEMVVVLLAVRDLRLDRLTLRQRTVLDRVALGESDAEIARTLGIAPATVSKHLEQIYERLGVHTRTAAAALLRCSWHRR